MANARAYGSITIVDIGDLGTLSVYPESNQPQYVIYDPNNETINGDGSVNNNECYNPNWSNNNLILTPTIYYGGAQLKPYETNASRPNSLKITWTRQFGTNDPVALNSAQEIVDNNNLTLTVKGNVLSTTNNTVAYICEVEYVEPQTGKALKAKGRISFGLIAQATKIKSCRITGGNAFLYNSSKQLTGAESITLEAHTTNCSISSWQYKNSAGTYEDIKVGGNKMSATTFVLDLKNNKIGTAGSTVDADPNQFFVNDVATIRLQTNDADVYDVHMIAKIYDGAAGSDVLNATLSNEDMYVPCDSKGNPTDNAFNNAYTSITVYNGDTDITNYRGVTITSTNDAGVIGEWVRQPAGTDDDKTPNAERDTTPAQYKVTGLATDTGKVTFTIKYTFEDINGKTITKTIVKTFYLTKLKAGADGETPSVYSLELSTLALNKTADGTKTYTPSSFTARAYKITGDKREEYTTGRYKVYKLNSANGDSYTEVTTMGSGDKDVASITVGQAALDGKDYYGFRVELYESGGFTKKLDAQTIAVISDGVKGNDGNGGLSFNLGDYSTQIPCTADGKVASQYVINIPFTVYQGITKIACTASCNKKPSDNVGFEVQNGTADAEGSIVITIPKDEEFGNLDVSNDKIQFNIELSATVGSETYTSTQVYTIVRNRKAVDGTNAVTLRVYARNGNVINNGENNVELTCVLTDGANTKVPSSCKWYVFDIAQNGYVEIGGNTPPLNDSGSTKYTGYTGQTLIVPSDAVDGYASYRIDAYYGGNSTPYSDYISVIDKTDPLQVEIFSTLGDKITNSVGIGCVYAVVYQNGVELDPLQNLTVSVDAPATKVIGDVWAHIDSSDGNKKINFKKYTLKGDGTYAWEALNKTETQKECTYTWKFGDYSGNPTALNGKTAVNDRFLYIEGSYIAKKMQFNLEVTKK